ncbi:MAG: barstar family protein [Alphaproteobacteria bacterium]|nr:barstar family protein [Alphaproteobacteria bacterium]
MKTVYLDLQLASRDAILTHLARHLDFPGHFAPNLDALWDVLSRDVIGPFEIVWRDHVQARAALGAEFEKLAALFRQLAEDRADVRFRLA